jgi:6-pyruvoyltetrahydropterin/6-carboxytetrahydropterin synthase
VFEVGIRSRFSAAHHLRNYPGCCAVPHGHNWDVEVYLRGGLLNNLGMLMDFRQIKTAVLEMLGELDHKDLNTLPAFLKENPTSEALAAYIYKGLGQRLPPGGDVRVHRVSVHETPDTTATYQETD